MIKFDFGRSFSSFFTFTNATIGHSDEMLAVGIEPEAGESESTGEKDHNGKMKDGKAEDSEAEVVEKGVEEENGNSERSDSSKAPSELTPTDRDESEEEEKLEDEVENRFLPPLPEEDAPNQVVKGVDEISVGPSEGFAPLIP